MNAPRFTRWFAKAAWALDLLWGYRGWQGAGKTSVVHGEGDEKRTMGICAKQPPHHHVLEIKRRYLDID